MDNSDIIIPSTGESVYLPLKAKFLYCYGNSLPEDLLLYHKTPEFKTLSVLSVGCGDLRHFLFTLSEESRKFPTGNPNSPSYEFTFNDWYPEIIARNSMILFALFTDPNLSAEYLSEFWYSLQMTAECHEYWKKKIIQCISTPKETLPFKFTSNSYSRVRFIWKSWLNFDWDVDTMLKKRKECLLNRIKNQLGKKYESYYDELALTYSVLMNPDLKKSDKIKKECFKYISIGSLNQGPLVNPTLFHVLDDGSFFYCLHYGTHMFQAHGIRPNLGCKESLLKNLDTWMKSFRLIKFQIKDIIFGVDNVLTFMDSLISNKNRYDVIETSNLTDHVGMLNLLISGSVLLKNPKESIIRTCSFFLNTIANSPKEYLYEVTKLPESCYETVLGLELRSPNQSSWQSQVGSFQKTISSLSGVRTLNDFEYFIWRKASPPSFPIDLNESEYLLNSLKTCAESLACSIFRKNCDVGASQVNPGFFMKMIAFAVASERITLNTNAGLNFPIEDYKKLWQALLFSKQLLGTMSEMFLFGNLFGFAMNSDSEYSNPPYMLSHVFQLNGNFEELSYIFSIELQTGPVNHTIESLNLKFLDGNKLAVKCYVPGFISGYNPRSINLTLYARTQTMHGSPIVLPASSKIKLSEVSIKRCKHNSLTSITKGTIDVRNKKDILKYSWIIETELDFTVKLLFGENSESKILMKENDNNDFMGIFIDGEFMDIVLPSNVALKSCKIHRKSKFILIHLLKRAEVIVLPSISLNGLSKIKEAPPVSMNTMFFDKIKATNKKFTGLNGIIHDLRENIQIIFRLAVRFKAIVIKDELENIIGLLYNHGMYSYPAIDSIHDSTPMIDASVLFKVDLAMLVSIFNAIPLKKDKIAELILKEREIVPFKQLFDIYKGCSINGKHADVSKISHQNFERCVVFPLYDLATKLKKQSKDLDMKLKLNDCKNEMMKSMDALSPMERFQKMQEVLLSNPKILESVSKMVPSGKFQSILEELNIKT